ncbi:MAG: glycosyltransferase family 2 protein, partial [Candidatus Omnitrophica bacterium]|nr:glycosyltransferase family 2 protein [Candidatus Omnitrophota bacterium]
DIICGSRFITGSSIKGYHILKKISHRIYNSFFSFLFSLHLSDFSNSFKMYKKEVLDNIDIKARGFEISLEMCLKAYFLGYKITEIPTMWIDRKKGKSKFSMFRMAPAYIKLYLWAIFRSLLP